MPDIQWGEGLCITTCLKAHAEALPLPAAIVTFSAGLDATRTGASIDAKNGIDPYFTREVFNTSGRVYFGGTDPHKEPFSSSVYAELTGFPSILRQVGTNELLLDDLTRLAQRARDAELDVFLDLTAKSVYTCSDWLLLPKRMS